MSVLLFNARERITSWRIWRSYLLGPRINKNWRQNLWISDFIGWNDITFDCNQTSFPNFVNGWTLSRWIRRRFVQKRLSIILMTCRHSIDCIMRRDFKLDRIRLGQIELRWVYDCSKSFSQHSWIQPLKIWTRPLCRRSHLPSWCARQQQWETPKKLWVGKRLWYWLWEGDQDISWTQLPWIQNSWHQHQPSRTFSMKKFKRWLWKRISKSNSEKTFAEILLKEWNLCLPIFE